MVRRNSATKIALATGETSGGGILCAQRAQAFPLRLGGGTATGGGAPVQEKPRACVEPVRCPQWDQVGGGAEHVRPRSAPLVSAKGEAVAVPRAECLARGKPVLETCQQAPSVSGGLKRGGGARLDLPPPCPTPKGSQCLERTSRAQARYGRACRSGL